MAAFILVIGVLNFVLGYLLALALADPPFLGLLAGELWRNAWRGMLVVLKRQRVTEVEAGYEADTPPDQQEDTPALPAVATISELPELWQHVLGDNGLQLNTLVSGVAHFLRLEGAVYLEQLLTAEVHSRQAVGMQDPLTLERLSADLRFINLDWSRKLREAAEFIEERLGRLGPGEVPALRLARLLQDQGGQIAEIGREAHAPTVRADGTVGCRRVVGKLQQLIRLAHLLRDEIQVLLAAIYRAEGILSQLDSRFHLDAATGMRCRLGLEAMFAAEFQEGTRPTVAMRISLDRFGKVNQRLGGRAGDQTLRVAAQFLAELSAGKCDESAIARLAGGDFLILAHDSTMEELAAVGEHIRQSFEAADFCFQGTNFSLTLTISVATVAANAGLTDILDRLEAVRAAATKAGQNRGARWENGGPILTLPPAIPVPARTITVEATAA
ncbi:MAG: GGDEF domain-containing protein [Pirellulaceae bacterium]